MNTVTFTGAAFTVILAYPDGALLAQHVECPRHLAGAVAAVNAATHSAGVYEPSDFTPLAVIPGHVKVEFLK